MVYRRAAIVAVACALLMAGTASAQWRGLGRVMGVVTDETGAPVAGATVRADLMGVGGTVVQTNEKGEWTVTGIAKGQWVITVAKDGLALQKQSVVVREMAAPEMVKTTMKKQ
jgi:hypothetical protein